MLNISKPAGTDKPVETGKTPRYVALNRNLGNFPLARDPRRHADWQLSKSWWSCALPGDERIHLFLPGSWSRDRCRLPTGFDMAVLFELLATARLTISGEVTVAAIADFLRRLGVADNWRYRRQLTDAFELWQALHVTFDQWYVAHPVRARRMVKLRPPLTPLQSRKRRGLCFKLDAGWLDWQTTFFEKIRLPLPVNAATQNIVLTVHCGVSEVSDEHDFTGRLWAPRVHAFARKIGLEHRHRSVLQKALDEASRWYIAHGGMLLPFFQNDRIDLKATIPDVRNQKPETVSEPVAPVEEWYTPMKVKIPFEFTRHTEEHTEGFSDGIDPID
jgi:hypothetical protein